MKTSTADLAATIRQHVAGRALSSVTFVMGYIRLGFDPPPTASTINALTPVTVRSDGKCAITGDDQFRNLLCDLVPKSVVDILLEQEYALTLQFEDGSSVSMSLREEHCAG